MSDRDVHKISESTFSLSEIERLIAQINEIVPLLLLIDLTFINFLGIKKQFNNISALKDELRTLNPIERTHLKFTFHGDFSRDQTKKRILKATLSLSEKENESELVIMGHQKTRAQILDSIRPLLHPYRRKFTNKIGQIVVPVIATGFAAYINYNYPKTIFGGSSFLTWATASFAAVGLIYFQFRPYCLFRETWFEEVLIFSSYRQILLFLPKLLMFIAFASLLTLYAPSFLEHDKNLVMTDPSTQRKVLRNLVSSDFLKSIESLKAGSTLYEKTEGIEQRELTVSPIVSNLQSLMQGGHSLSDFPIGKLQYFLDSSHSLQRGNTLQETPLLGMKIEGETFEYRPRIFLSPDAPPKRVSFDDWMNGLALKDKFGTTWTRSSLVRDLYEESKGTLSKDRADKLRRLREFPETSLTFQAYKKTTSIPPQNSVIDESVRAISEELLRSVNVIQQDLSAYPGSPND